MLFSNYHFRFSLLGTILALIGILIFSTLGTWQVYRALEKQNLQIEMDAKERQPVFQLENNAVEIENRKYLKVIATGKYDDSNEILIDNSIHNGSAGYHVMTPFILKGDKSVIMVNRGWVPVGNDRNILPILSATDEELVIHGIISPPKSLPPVILGEPDINSKVWLYFDTTVYEKKIGSTLLPVIILLDKDDSFGYIREWPKYEVKVGMHIGYAIQWYVFAFIVLITYLGVNFKKRNQDDR